LKHWFTLFAVDDDGAPLTDAEQPQKVLGRIYADADDAAAARDDWNDFFAMKGHGTRVAVWRIEREG